MKRQHSVGDGRFAAYKTLLDGVPHILGEFKKLNTREARAAFADHWIGVWADDFDQAWPVVYELLNIIKEDELFKDPRRVGPGAPGGRETHGQRSSYSDFAAYFTDRVRQPFDRWAELEQTYRYAQTYAPEIFKVAFPEAVKLGAAHHAGPGRGKKTSVNNTGFPRGATRAAYIRARLERDGHTEELAAIERKETTAHAVAVKLGWRKPQIQLCPTVEGYAESIKRHLNPEQQAQLIAALQGVRDAMA
jgi:hypothetical protein